MTYATLMVHLELGRSNNALLNFTADLANRMNAGVIGIVACQPLPVVYSDGMMMGDYIQQDRDDLMREMKDAKAEFHDVLHPRVSDLQWRSTMTIGALCDYAAEEARSADLIVVSAHKDAASASPRRVVTSDLIMRAGRPVLLVPEAASALGSDRMVVAWKDTREARRALHDALPMLKLAAEVVVVEIAVSEELRGAQRHLDDLGAWLKRHAITARSAALLTTGNDALMLRSFIDDQQADLVVAGGYGHSRLREWALGGVTRDFLLHANCCSLVSH